MCQKLTLPIKYDTFPARAVPKTCNSVGCLQTRRQRKKTDKSAQASPQCGGGSPRQNRPAKRPRILRRRQNAGAKKPPRGRHWAISISEAQDKRLGGNFRVRHQRAARLLYRALRRVVGREQQPRASVPLAGALHEGFYRNSRVGKYPRY